MQNYIITSEHGTSSVQAATPAEAARRGRTAGTPCYMQVEGDGDHGWWIGPRGGLRRASAVEVMALGKG